MPPSLIYKALFLSLALHTVALMGLAGFLEPAKELPSEMAFSFAFFEEGEVGQRSVEAEKEPTQQESVKLKAISSGTLKSKNHNAAVNKTAAADVSGAGKLTGPSQNENGATITYAPNPPYPVEARKVGFEGTVVLDLTIGERGEVIDITKVVSSGRNDCDQAAMDTISNLWRFLPAMVDGQPIVSRHKIAVRYVLK